MNVILITMISEVASASMQKFITEKYIAQTSNVKHNQNIIIFAIYGTEDKR
jgi:hypothetical protein